MDTTAFFPALTLFLILAPFAAGVLSYLLDKVSARARDLCACSAAVLALAGCVLLGACQGRTFELFTVFGMGVGFQASGLQWLLCLPASFLWTMSHLFATYYLAGHHEVGRYCMFSLFTLGAILGVFLSADFYTALVFFEIMSFTSWVLVIHERSTGALDAAASYLGFAVIGGLATLLGLFLLFDLCGTVRFDELNAAAALVTNRGRLYTAAAFTLVGFAAKAGMWPLHTWLPSAHPVAPAPASALLSGIITKAGVFGIFAISAKIFLHDAAWGLVMLCFGTVTMVTGAVLAVFSVNLKRTLACSSMSQIGFILVGVGMQGLLGEENALAVWGSILHVMNHSLLKLCLFACSGVVVRMLHKLDLNEIRGCGRGKPLFCFAFLMGVLGITGVPGMNGYISKTLLHEGIAEYIAHLAHLGESAAFFKAVEWLFLFSGGLTVAYMVKLFVCLFLDRNTPEAQAHSDEKNGRYLTKPAAFVLAVSGGVLPVFGLFPHQTFDRVAALADGFFSSEGPAHAIHYFSLVNLKGAAVSLVIGTAVYFGVVRTLLMKNGRYVDRWPAWLDLEKRVYRPVLFGLARLLGTSLAWANRALSWLMTTAAPFFGAFVARLLSSLFEWVAAFLRGVLFWNATDTIIPKEDERFAVYDKDITGTRGFRGTLAFGFLMFGAALAGMLAYVLFF